MRVVCTSNPDSCSVDAARVLKAAAVRMISRHVAESLLSCTPVVMVRTFKSLTDSAPLIAVRNRNPVVYGSLYLQQEDLPCCMLHATCNGQCKSEAKAK